MAPDPPRSPSTAPPAPTLDVLLGPAGPGGRIPAEPGEATLAELYAHPDPGAGAAWVRANMIATLDGAATGPDGRSGSINGPADHRVFALLRSLADVVLVGAATVRAEGYRELPIRADLAGPRATRGSRPALELAVVTRSGPVPDELLDSAHPPLVVTVGDRPDLDGLRRRIGAERVVVAGTGDVDLARALAALAARGLPRVLTEGGPHLLGRLLAAGLVDDLCLTTSPLIAGDPGPRVVAGTGWLSPPVPARPAHLLHADGVLLGRWLVGRHAEQAG
ncbi:dihydrofolate reductase family protein [Cellulomonas aerilata]|uniref:Bacterial bifunctional deaminase-reductase C-terminal domain-containing protein n=1 Tax=Cellulomonas aerilata TaxID=515326 RepID=A0A512DAX8_9CELL|nr:dihydrofolate reductase family protein [Cellulomonas aerilata]GEO33633.1 hypothetical protein CAE01nite_13580 [Cellulomonas aerilata]